MAYLSQSMHLPNLDLVGEVHYWDECIDPTFGAVDLKTEVVMIPKKVRASIDF